MAGEKYTDGFKELEKRLKKAAPEIRVKVDAAAEAVAQEIAEDAKLRAPIDMGTLRGSIAPVPTEGGWKVVANSTGAAPYAPFVEFGTGARFDKTIPAEWAAVAAKFKGTRTGSFEDGLDSIKQWCRRNGIEEDQAYFIFVSILRNGLKPRPYLWPAYVTNVVKFLNDVEDILQLYGKTK